MRPQKNAFDITIGDSILTKVLKNKFLRVTLDENLTFNDHVNKVTSKIPKAVGVTRLPEDVRPVCQLPEDNG